MKLFLKLVQKTIYYFVDKNKAGIILGIISFIFFLVAGNFKNESCYKELIYQDFVTDKYVYITADNKVISSKDPKEIVYNNVLYNEYSAYNILSWFSFVAFLLISIYSFSEDVFFDSPYRDAVKSLIRRIERDNDYIILIHDRFLSSSKGLNNNIDLSFTSVLSLPVYTEIKEERNKKINLILEEYENESA